MSYQYPFPQGHSSMPATPSYHWEDSEQLHQHQHHHQHAVLDQELQQLSHQPDQQTVYATSPTTTVHIPELVPVVPSQNPVRSRPGSSFERDQQELRLQHVSMSAQPPPHHLRLDTQGLPIPSASLPSGPPSADATGVYRAATGPIRVSPVHTDHRDAVHPYMRVQNIAASNVGTSRVKTKSKSKSKSRPPQEEESVRFAEPSTSSAPKPTPPASTPRESTAAVTPNLATFSRLMTTTKGLINTAYSGSGPNPGQLIRTDVHFDPETKILTAMCDLPGKTKSDINLVLATNPFTRAKQLTITAKNTPIPGFPANEFLVRERKDSNTMSRILIVPLETKPSDITLSMKDGILFIAIQCPTPLLVDDSEEIEIR